MSRFFLLFLLLLITNIASAQGTWRRISYTDKELGGKHTEAYEYTVENVGRFVFWDFEEGRFQLFCDSTTFITKAFDTPLKTYVGCKVNIQTFRKTGMPVSTYEVWLDKRRDITGNCLQTESRLNNRKLLSSGREDYSWNEKMRRLFFYLKNDKGYVIITAPVSGEQKFSIKITPVDIK